MTQAIEITTFKLAGYSCAEFAEANAELDDWLRQQPGFQSRRMAEQPDGTIVDMLLWDSVAKGTASMHRLMDEMRYSPVHSMIDQETVSWNIAPVRHHIKR
ncbi:hypothetical protein [Collimonas arenae]|uniref:hypothetical protein n=1 Tax=Collimonas arenae TaxID=279058 RepID=UPI00056F7E84|nr:hypothetical protein [Collimonas arenae]